MSDVRTDDMTIEEILAYPWPKFETGDRVEIAGSPVGITLVSPYGTIVGPDPDWPEFYYLVDLDVPVPHWDSGELVTQIADTVPNLTRVDLPPAHPTSADEPVSRISEAVDNLTLVDRPGDGRS